MPGEARPLTTKDLTVCTNAISTGRAARSLAAEHEADHLARLADLIGRTTYRGRGLDGRPLFTVDSDLSGRPIHLTQAAVRRLVGPEPSDLAVARLRDEFAAFVDEVQFEVESLVMARHVERQCGLEDSVAELRAVAADPVPAASAR